MRAKGITKQKIAEKEAAEKARLAELARKVSLSHQLRVLWLDEVRGLNIRAGG